MRRYQFMLRHVLISLPIVAMLLVTIRYALRWPGLAAGLMVAGIAACIMLAASVVLYTLFAGVGMLSFDRPESEYRPDRVERSAARRDAAAPGHFGNEPGAHPT